MSAWAGPVAVVRHARRRPRRRRALVIMGLASVLVALFWLRVLGGSYLISNPDCKAVAAN